MEASDWLLPALGFLGGVLLGLAARLARFCTLSAIEDAIFGVGTLRLRMWGVAIAVAALLTFGASAIGLVNTGGLFYLVQPVPLLSTVLGGLAFGLGMALVGTCGYGALVRLGGGDLSGLVAVLIIGIAGYIASGGFIGVLRVAVLPSTATLPESGGIAHAIAAGAGLAPHAVGIAMALALGAACMLAGGWRAHPGRLGWSMVVGLSVALGWIATQWAHDASFGEVQQRSFSFVGPVGDSILYLMTSSGTRLGFGAASVFGVIAGALAGALAKDEFRWEACDDAPTLKRQILGATLMGVGGVFAMGCTVGQGLSAASVFAVSAPAALVSMFVGAWCGLQWLVRGSVLDAFRDLSPLRR